MKTLMDLHIHSCYSTHWLWGYSCLTTPEEIVSEAIKKGLKVISISDHDSIKGGQLGKKISKKKNLIVIPSIEITTKDGHFIGLNVNELVPKGLTAEETVDKIKEQGALALAPHPTFYFNSLGAEKVKELKLDAVEAFNARCKDTNKSAQDLAIELNLPITGGSDAHAVSEIGNGVSITENEIEGVDDVLNAIKKKQISVGGHGTTKRQIISTLAKFTLSKIYSPLRPTCLLKK